MSTEVERVARATRGEVEAWREIYDLHAPVLRRACATFAALSSADGEELVQETFVDAMERIGDLRDPTRLRPWLLAIARSRCLKRLRRGRVERRVVETLAFEPSGSPDADEERAGRERVAIVRELIDALPAGPERETVILFYVEGRLSAREIAERLGVGKSAVTMRLERFRARVKRQLAARLLGDEDDGDS
jgi:RNA polymerase sigma-70 factor (ECF subfamily)